MTRTSLRTRLAVVVAATVAGVVLLVAALTFTLVGHQVTKGQDVSLLREATRIQRLIDAQADYVASGSDNCRYTSEPGCTRVVSSEDRPFDDGTALAVTGAAVAVARGDRDAAYDTVVADDVEVRTIVLPTRGDTAVMVGVPTEATDETMRRVGAGLLAGGAAGVLLSAVVGWLVATVGLRPVADLAASIRRVASTRDPHDRVEISRDDELGRLGSAFNAMLEQLAAATTAQRQLVADASHELRTPLTTLRTNIALLGRGDALAPPVRERLRVDVERELLGMQDLVDDLVELARGDDTEPDAHPVPVRRSIDAAAAAARRHWPDVTFDVVDDDDAGEVRVFADPDRLERLWNVLLDNAGKYGPRPGRVEIAVTRTASSVLVRVVDHGAGIREDDLPRIFDRFYRSPHASRLPGSGLGLAIAHQTVQQAGGDIAASTTDGGGTTMTVTLPVATDE
ncbi:ATP-binding protein [Frigoribacterium sp. R86507]|uniref:HAMP domain-containing sensor histidine kinase n=1 Tax=Frigoribacterium sp. R86507 TaxID=3093850 RepID=UPI0037C9253B